MEYQDLDIAFIIKFILYGKIFPSKMVLKKVCFDDEINFYHPFILKSSGRSMEIWYWDDRK